MDTFSDFSKQKMLYKAFSRGLRMGRKGKFYHSNVVANPFKYQTSEWYCFNQGWNESIQEVMKLSRS